MTDPLQETLCRICRTHYGQDGICDHCARTELRRVEAEREELRDNLTFRNILCWLKNTDHAISARWLAIKVLGMSVEESKDYVYKRCRITSTCDGTLKEIKQAALRQAGKQTGG